MQELEVKITISDWLVDKAKSDYGLRTNLETALGQQAFAAAKTALKENK